MKLGGLALEETLESHDGLDEERLGVLHVEVEEAVESKGARSVGREVGEERQEGEGRGQLKLSHALTSEHSAPARYQGRERTTNHMMAHP